MSEKPPLPTEQYDAPPPYSTAQQQPMYPQQQQQPMYPQQQQQTTYTAPAAGGYNAPAPGYNAQPAGYYAPNTPMQQTNVVIRPANVMVFGDHPASLTCPHCSANIVTRIDYQIGTMVWLIAGVMILFGLWLGCCLIPFCIDSLKDVAHFCPNCNRHLGTKQRLS